MQFTKILMLSITLLLLTNCTSGKKLSNRCGEQAYGEHNKDIKDATSDIYDRCQARHNKAQQLEDEKAQKETAIESVVELLEGIF